MASPQKKMNADDLLKELGKVHPRNGTCQITMVNNTPADWGAVIVAAGCKFFYSDGTDYIDGPIGMSVGSGGAYTFVSDKPDGCVQGFTLAATVSVPNQGDQTVTASDSCTPDECILHETEVLGQQATVAKGKLKEAFRFEKRK